ncbi:MAG: insulinase family protein, partial [Paludibacteraceae bacterium]|nr:insulinase family protein [Paludibacteraceae bacterium]
MKKKIFLSVLTLVLTTLCVAQDQTSQSRYSYRTVDGDPLQARIYTLPNGLTVYLSQNKEKPEIQTLIAVRAGSQNDPLESTGLAHYQEHIMFKGTASYGTTNYDKEVPNLNAIDSLYELYGHSSDTAHRKAIYHLIDSFSYENSKIAVANEFDKLMSAIGATGVNAFTSTDMTCYHEVIPAGELTRWAMIEADRFQNLVVRGFHTELETVYEEFNMYSTMDEDKVLLAIDQLLYPNIPYRQHTVLGTQEDLKNPSLKNIKKFYQTYYRPNNVAVCLAGDFDFDHAIEVVDKYFGAWEPKEIPAVEEYQQPDLQAPKDTIVYGKEASEVWLAWKLPNVRHEDFDALSVMYSVMDNNKCGLMNINVEQKQKILRVWDYIQEGNDYSTYYFVGTPKENQTLDKVRKIILDEVEKLKKGEFSDDLLRSILRNEKRDELIGQQNNRNRAMDFVQAHIYQIPYEQIVHRLDRLEKLTKNDIVRVANKYLKDNYVCVYKQLSDKDVNPPKVEKPAITPIEMNRDTQSLFYTNLVAMEAERQSPQFLDFTKDLTISTLPNGVELLYCQNTENELARLNFVIGKGFHQDPKLYAVYMLDYLGTSKMTVEAYKTQLYALAADAWVSVSSNDLYLNVYSLQETLSDALKLLEDKLLTAPANKVVSKVVLKKLIKGHIKAHEDAKTDQRSCFSKLQDYGMRGADVVKQLTMTPEQLKKLTAKEVLQNFRALLPAIERVEYFGPLSEAEVKQMLQSSQLLAKADSTKRVPAKRIEREVVNENEVLIAPYDANNVYLLGYANWGEVYTPKDEAIIRLFNEYFSGSMGSIVFQEMREARALCYSSSANFVTPYYKGENNWFYTFILSQNDKMKDCI